MAEAAINRRKSQIFFNNIAPVTKTYEEVVKEKLKIGKFPLTKTGCLKMLGMLVLLFGLVLFISQPLCNDTDEWFQYLFPCAVGLNLGVQLILFLIFSFGLTVNHPELWVRLDIVVNLLLSIDTIIAAIFTNLNCTENRTIDKVPQPLGITGAIIIIISCAGLFLLYRFNEDDHLPKPANNFPEEIPEDRRKSIFA